MPQGSSSRNGARVRLIAVHTAEGARTNRDLDAYFTRSQVGSSHAGVDDSGLVEGWVPYGRASWTLRSGNPISDNMEICGFAKWTRAQWLNHPVMVESTAQWIASRCRARGIPCVKLTGSDVRAGKSGVIGHIDWTEGMKDGSHWDPGPGFPWDVVISRAQAILGGSATQHGGAEMNGEERQWLQGQLNALAERTTAAQQAENTNANLNAGRLDKIAAALEGARVQEHNNANANARRLESLLTVAERIAKKLGA